MVSVPTSRPSVPGSDLGPRHPHEQCGLRGGRSHCNSDQIMEEIPRPRRAVKKKRKKVALQNYCYYLVKIHIKSE